MRRLTTRIMVSPLRQERNLLCRNLCRQACHCADFRGFRLLPAVIFTIIAFSPCAFAQFRTTSRQVSETQGSQANQLPLSGRSGQTGSVTATQTPTPGTTTSVNTINPTVQTQGPYSGSVWGAARVPFSGRLSLR